MSNQGSAAYDADKNGKNESTLVTSASNGTPGLPTTFVIAGAATVAATPALSPLMLLVLGGLLMMVAARRTRRG